MQLTMQTARARALDYAPCQYGTSRLLFRGPQRKAAGDYITCIGNTETFGRFISEPYPELLERSLGTPCINLGCRDAGLDAFLANPSLIDIAAGSRVTVIQVMGAISMSNRFYTVDPRRNDYFIRAGRKLKDIYPEVDFREFERTEHMLTALARTCPKRLQLVRRELQTAWVARMRALVGQIPGPVVLLWMSDHAPYSRQDGGTICHEPLFVDRAMLNAVCETGAQLIEVVATQAEIDAGLPDMIYGQFEAEAACEMLGPVVHRRVARVLCDALLPILMEPAFKRTAAE
ncbi:DUF6473 family protein [Pseudoruegeria sp. HB172150]|uniref:DUF6473 family protein n=1 Tax=Pseudoruegeria sp. HB172150 TaxID=2721164 RepID=UPI001C13000B|nr:DUF6473 family protein [Pseudoruegeria sp. HB172150]